MPGAASSSGLGAGGAAGGGSWLAGSGACRRSDVVVRLPGTQPSKFHTTHYSTVKCEKINPEVSCYVSLQCTCSLDGD